MGSTLAQLVTIVEELLLRADYSDENTSGEGEALVFSFFKHIHISTQQTFMSSLEGRTILHEGIMESLKSFVEDVQMVSSRTAAALSSTAHLACIFYIVLMNCTEKYR